MKKTIGTFILILLGGLVFSQEICDNGIDDDLDGLIDLNDSLDCLCVSDSIKVSSSYIPNHSFEDTLCCPYRLSQMSCASTWIQASIPTSDYMNACGFITPSAIQNGIFPVPDGNAAVGTIFVKDWQEYVGAVLDPPMIAGEKYVLQFYVASAPMTGGGDTCSLEYPDISLSLFSNVSDNVMPFVGVGCPPADEGWQLLGSTNYTPSSKWSVATIEFVPDEDVHSITLGSPCQLPNVYNTRSNCVPYFYFDNLVLNESSTFYLNQIKIDTNLLCNNPFVGASVDINGGDWTWYYNGVSLLKEHSDKLGLEGRESGIYTVRYYKNSFCYGTTDVKIDLNSTLKEVSFEMNLCGKDPTMKAFATANDGYWNWFYNGDSLANEHSDILHLNDKESGTYTANFIQNDRCYASSDILIDLSPKRVEVKIPNVFSPNKDGLNDRFFVQGIPKNSSEITLSIFNRWGEKIHSDEGNNISWNGTYKDELLPEGTYFYKIELVNGCDEPKTYSGNLSLFQ